MNGHLTLTSHDTPLSISEETESTKVMTQSLDKIARKFSGLTQKKLQIP